MRNGYVWMVSCVLLMVFLGWVRPAFAQAPAPAADPAALAVPAPAPAPAAAAPAVVPPAAATSPAPGLEVPKEAPAKAHGTGIIAIIWKSGFFGVLIWLMLVIASIIAVALTIDSFVNIREKKIAPASLVDAVRAAMKQGDVMKALQQCEANPGPLSHVLSAGFSNVKEGYEVIQDSVSIAADIESEKILQRVTYLSVISNTTPMLGLIGTVQGMIFAFLTLGTQAAGAAQQASLAMNISHGLWATAVGLGTAVPATIFYFFFKNKAMRIILGMEAMTLDLIKALRNVEIVEE
ncbi:MAG: MotA/TolQ/ExbB proton channel family protein [Kiritimatiellaeota bacterium]|nr:MotA/TolQ/ExbB proton channel family protein [Kiritimatiellota bacterium]